MRSIIVSMLFAATLSAADATPPDFSGVYYPVQQGRGNRGGRPGGPPAHAGTTFRGQALQRPAVEAPMATGGGVDRDAALVRPAAERVGVDPEQTAGGAERKWSFVVAGTRGDGHCERLHPQKVGKSGSAGQSGQADYPRRSADRQTASGPRLS